MGHDEKELWSMKEKQKKIGGAMGPEEDTMAATGQKKREGMIEKQKKGVINYAHYFDYAYSGGLQLLNIFYFMF